MTAKAQRYDTSRLGCLCHADVILMFVSSAVALVPTDPLLQIQPYFEHAQ